jgi:SnoaL-like protein
MDDRNEIADVIVRYASGIDGRDWELFRSCFTTDCLLDYRPIGRWKGIDAVTGFMRRTHSGPSLHRLTNITIVLNGDEARSRTYVDAVVTGPNGWGTVNTIGRYDDILTRTPAGWRIATRTATVTRLRLPGPLSLLPSSISLSPRQLRHPPPALAAARWARGQNRRRSRLAARAWRGA